MEPSAFGLVMEDQPLHYPLPLGPYTLGADHITSAVIQVHGTKTVSDGQTGRRPKHKNTKHKLSIRVTPGR